jgi:hypothetical protein
MAVQCVKFGAMLIRNAAKLYGVHSATIHVHFRIKGEFN